MFFTLWLPNINQEQEIKLENNASPASQNTNICWCCKGRICHLSASPWASSPLLAGAAMDRQAEQKPMRSWILPSFLPTALWGFLVFIVTSRQLVLGQGWIPSSHTGSRWFRIKWVQLAFTTTIFLHYLFSFGLLTVDVPVVLRARLFMKMQKESSDIDKADGIR